MVLLMLRRPPRSTRKESSAESEVDKRQVLRFEANSPKRRNEIENMFRTQLKKIDETINIELS